jgi:hypothetical protein
VTQTRSDLSIGRKSEVDKPIFAHFKCRAKIMLFAIVKLLIYQFRGD